MKKYNTCVSAESNGFGFVFLYFIAISAFVDILIHLL